MASKRRLRRKACEGKRRFATENEAKNAAFHASNKTSSMITPYRCKHCGQYHIGHPPKRVKQSILAQGRCING